MGIGKKIADIRNSIGFSQKDLCIRTGLDKTHISRIENEHSSPTFETVEKILNGMGLEMSFLTSESEMGSFINTHEFVPAKPKNKILARIEECFDKLDKDAQKMMLSLAEQLSRPRGDNQQAA